MTTYKDLADEAGMQVYQMLEWADLPGRPGDNDEVPEDAETLVRRLMRHTEIDGLLDDCRLFRDLYTHAEERRKDTAMEAMTAGASRSDVARAAGVSRQTLINWTNGAKA